MKCLRLTVVLFVAIFLAGAVTFLWLRVVAGGFSARAKPAPIERLAAETARKLAMPKRAKNMRNPVPYSAAILEDAQVHWADHCAFCHADDGSGNTEVGRNLYPKPPDMRSLQTQFLSDGELYFIINNGVRLTGMPAWGRAGEDDEDSWKLVYFIRHLPKMTSHELEAMKQLNPEACMEREEQKKEEQFLNGVPEKELPPRKK